MSAIETRGRHSERRATVRRVRGNDICAPTACAPGPTCTHRLPTAARSRRASPAQRGLELTPDDTRVDPRVAIILEALQ